MNYFLPPIAGKSHNPRVADTEFVCLKNEVTMDIDEAIHHKSFPQGVKGIMGRASITQESCNKTIGIVL